MSRYDELYHHGVKGMKWGVRKDRGSSTGGALRTAFKVTHPITYAVGKKVRSSEKIQNRANRARNLLGSKRTDSLKKYRNMDVNKMSNKELQDAITRMNLERNYRNLTKIDFMRGQKVAENVLKYSGSAKGINKMREKGFGQ